MSSRKNKPRRLRVESLEKRTMLDGNVTASVVSGVLVVTGDASATGSPSVPLRNRMSPEAYGSSPACL